MKKSLIFIFILFLSINSCDSHLDKSILEPLSISELKKESNDSLFLEAYKYTQHVINDVLISDADKVKYSDLTYGEIKEFTKTLVDYEEDEDNIKQHHSLAFEFFNLLKPDDAEIKKHKHYYDSISNLCK